ncbi:restriction endonuclease subunit S [Methylicorpusculum oleiharenae]|uniref:restriction endonuclease subunit S n=1 Tax=Methylicorpusculum oleiharenae TaxID=1338687 RepID=UPI0013576DA7|nr:restriction endonuclease subunit S [Methylicorpusculum oleiharenae]MCD2451252.1 restriction endonuclease subunit S [Methylicorpusculum oleiharenae]
MSNDKQLPEGWRMVKFGDMAKHISKRVEPSETDLNIYVGLEHLDPDSLRIKRHGVPSDVAGQKLLVKKGQIIFGKRRAYQRKLGVADWDCICSAHAMVLEANPKTVLPEFLPFYMQSDVFMNRAISISEGSLSPTIKWKILAIQNFLIPNLEYQENYVRIFKTRHNLYVEYESAIESGLRAINNILSYRKNSRWKSDKLGDLLEEVIDYRGKSPPKSDSGVPLITAKNIRHGYINEEPKEYIPESKYLLWMNRGMPMPGDILFTTEAPLGNIAFAPAYKFALGQRTVCLRPVLEKVSSKTLFWLLQTKLFKHKLSTRTTGTTAQGVKVKELLNLVIDYPPTIDQIKFSDCLEEINKTLELILIAQKSLPNIDQILEN